MACASIQFRRWKNQWFFSSSWAFKLSREKGETDNIERVDNLNNKSRKCASPKNSLLDLFFSFNFHPFFFKIILKFKIFMRKPRRSQARESKKITKKKIGASVATFLVLFCSALSATRPSTTCDLAWLVLGAWSPSWFQFLLKRWSIIMFVFFSSKSTDC